MELSREEIEVAISWAAAKQAEYGFNEEDSALVQRLGAALAEPAADAMWTDGATSTSGLLGD